MLTVGFVLGEAILLGVEGTHDCAETPRTLRMLVRRNPEGGGRRIGGERHDGSWQEQSCLGKFGGRRWWSKCKEMYVLSYGRRKDEDEGVVVVVVVVVVVAAALTGVE